jgi:hypothetical protein
MIWSEPRCGPFRNEFGANDRYVAGSVDPQPHLASLEPDHRDADVVAYEELFHELPGQHQHVCLPIHYAQVRFQPTFHLTGHHVMRVRGTGAYEEPSLHLSGLSAPGEKWAVLDNSAGPRGEKRG